MVCEDAKMRERVEVYQGKMRKSMCGDTYSQAAATQVGKHVLVRRPGLVEKGMPCWSDLKRLKEVLQSAVRLESGKM